MGQRQSDPWHYWKLSRFAPPSIALLSWFLRSGVQRLFLRCVFEICLNLALSFSHVAQYISLSGFRISHSASFVNRKWRILAHLRAFWCNYLNCILSDCALSTTSGNYIQVFVLSFGSNIALSFKIGQLPVFLNFSTPYPQFSRVLSVISPEMLLNRISFLLFLINSFHFWQKSHAYIAKAAGAILPFSPDAPGKRPDAKNERVRSGSGSFLRRGRRASNFVWFWLFTKINLNF